MNLNVVNSGRREVHVLAQIQIGVILYPFLSLLSHLRAHGIFLHLNILCVDPPVLLV
jgi:hypothetical protein